MENIFCVFRGMTGSRQNIVEMETEKMCVTLDGSALLSRRAGRSQEFLAMLASGSRSRTVYD